MGKVVNVNLPPCKSCDPSLPCFRSRECYAMKAYRMYRETREAWEANWRLASSRPYEFFRQVDEYIGKKKPRLVRWHTAGDFVDADYLRRVFDLAARHPDTKFLAFTKKYDLLLPYTDRRLKAWRDARNLTVVVSVWPGLAVPVAVLERFPAAYMRDPKVPDPRIPKKAKECLGDCEKCAHCWLMLPGKAVVFDKH